MSVHVEGYGGNAAPVPEFESDFANRRETGALRTISPGA